MDAGRAALPGDVISHALHDPRDRRTLLAGAKTGHLGPTVFRSTDFGRNWTRSCERAAVLVRRYVAARPQDGTPDGPKYMRVFVNGVQVFDLARALAPTDEIQIVQALSGG